MKIPFALFCISLLWFGCTNSTPVTSTETKDLGTIAQKENPDRASLHADSIDKTNAAIIGNDTVYIQKAIISRNDSSIWLTVNKYRDHRIFGYEKPDTHSKKMILISIFTNDVEGNPFNCPFGAYYESSGMKGMQLKFIPTQGAFIKAGIIRSGIIKATIFMGKKWFEFDN